MTRNEPKTVELAPGDVFLVPMPDGSFIPGRLTPEAGRAVFYRRRLDSATVPPTLHGAPTFELDGHITVEPIQTGRWPIVARETWPLGAFAFRRYLVPPYIACAIGPEGVFTDVSSKLVRPVGDEWRGLSKLSLFNESGVLTVLEKAVASDSAQV